MFIYTNIYTYEHNFDVSQDFVSSQVESMHIFPNGQLFFDYCIDLVPCISKTALNPSVTKCESSQKVSERHFSSDCGSTRSAPK